MTNQQLMCYDLYNDISNVIFIINAQFEIIYKNNKFKDHYSTQNFISTIISENTLHIDSKNKDLLSAYLNSDSSTPFKFTQTISESDIQYSVHKLFSNGFKHFIIIETNRILNHEANNKSLETDSVYKLFLKNMTESLVLYKVITNSAGQAIDFEYLSVNKAFEDAIGLTNDSVKGNLLFKEFPETEDYWKEVHIKAFNEQKLHTTTAYSVETDKYWELRAFPAGPNKIATLATDVTKQIKYKKSIQEKSEKLSNTEEKLRAYNEHLKYTCELIKESELSYKTLFEHNNDAILILVDNKIKDCNNKALALMNCQPYELIGKTFTDLSPEKQLDKKESIFHLNNFCENLKTDENFDIEWQFKRPDGKLVDTNLMLNCYLLKNTRHVYAIVKDLTKEKTYIEEIKENEYLLKQAQHTAKLGHWSFNMVLGGNMNWSNEMINIIESDEPTCFFDFFKTFVHTDDQVKIAPYFDHYTVIPESIDLQFKINTSSKKIKFVHLKGEIVAQQNNRIYRGIIQDITENYEQEQRILFESKINESLAHAGSELISPSVPIDNIVRTIFKACLELTQSETGFVAYDDPLSDKILIHFYDDSYINGHKVSNNIYFIERVKYNSEGLYGHDINLRELVSDNNYNKEAKRKIGNTSPKTIKNFLSVPSVINDVFMGQIVLVNTPNGFSEQQKQAIKTLSNIYGLAVYRKRMEWDLVASKEKAEESDRLKSAFLANMSHEIRTPMNAIVGFSQLLIHTDSDKKIEFGQLINNSCEDLLAIVNDIIDISKIEAGQLLIKPKNINLKKVLDEIHSLAKNKADLKDKKFPIYCENPIDENLELIVDVVRFKQIFLNLIDNAIKFTEHGSVTLGCEITNNNWLSFYVKDTGIGIPRHELDTVFESFRQVETTIDRTYGGTGLGLAISKNLVKQMGGSIKVVSKKNVGSQFWFDLPLRLPEDADPITINFAESKIELDLKNKEILIIEDEVRNAKLLNFFLEDSGANITLAFNGKEAINKAKEKKPDLVLLDIKMPDMDGIAVLKVLKQLYPEIVVIAQTAYAMKDDEKKCLDYGCDAYLAKPVKKDDLISHIKKFIR
ncbi:MAG: ATP-binding protein [Salinivirgaceae bacterium]|jgi:PAS domain S-box-containing protein|nr:ATP-binding protein [Salinivirgaceae bacterium]